MEQELPKVRGKKQGDVFPFNTRKYGMVQRRRENASLDISNNDWGQIEVLLYLAIEF